MEIQSTAALESALNQIELDLEAQRSFMSRHLQAALEGETTIPALEMLGNDLGIVPGNEDFKSFAAAASNAIGAKLKRFAESVAIFFDGTGKKELARLRREVEEVTGEARKGVISDRELANQFSIGSQEVRDVPGAMQKVVEFINALTDDYVPAILDRDAEYWHVLSSSRYFRSEGVELDTIGEMIDDMMTEVARHHPTHLSKLPDNGLTIFMGGRKLFTESKPPQFSLDRGANNPADTKVLRALQELTVSGAGRAGATNVTAQTHTGVIKTLSQQEMRDQLEHIERMVQLLERVKAIFQGTRRGNVQSQIQTILSTVEKLESYDVHNKDGSFVETITTSNLDRADSNRLKLLIAYITHSQFDLASLLINATHLIVGQYKAHVSYVKASMKMYR